MALRADMVMFGAYLAEGSRQFLRRKQMPGISAEQREETVVAEMVPQLLDAYGRIVQALFAQQRDHFAESVDRPSRNTGLPDDLSNRIVELPFIRPAVNHELGKRVCGVERDQLSRKPSRLPCQGAEACKMVSQRSNVIGGGNDNARTACTQCFIQEIGDFLKQARIVMVKADKMASPV